MGICSQPYFTCCWDTSIFMSAKPKKSSRVYFVRRRIYLAGDFSLLLLLYISDFFTRILQNFVREIFTFLLLFLLFYLSIYIIAYLREKFKFSLPPNYPQITNARANVQANVQPNVQANAHGEDRLPCGFVGCAAESLGEVFASRGQPHTRIRLAYVPEYVSLVYLP